MHFWPDRADVLAGRDEDTKGTWMGITRTGRVAVVTNYHEETPRHPPGTSPSRGELPVKFLDGDDAPVDFLRALEKQGIDHIVHEEVYSDGDSFVRSWDRIDRPIKFG